RRPLPARELDLRRLLGLRADSPAKVDGYPTLPRDPKLRLVVAALTEEALELSGEGVGGGELALLAEEVGLFGLDPGDQFLNLRVGGDGAADLLFVVGRFLFQLGGLDGDPGQA